MRYKYKNHEIIIEHDECSGNPRTEFDNLGTMVCFHNRYNLGDKTKASIEDLKAIVKDTKRYISLPLYLYDHSGITINTSGFTCQWDSGCIGAIYVSFEDIRKEYSCKRVTKKIREKVLNVLCSEVETYDNYLTGEVYSYTIEDKNKEEIDSCCGFYGSDHEKSGLLYQARAAIDSEISKTGEQLTLDI